MADRIKGITVEIGGDTTGLSKALSGVNKEIKNNRVKCNSLMIKILDIYPCRVYYSDKKIYPHRVYCNKDTLWYDMD